MYAQWSDITERDLIQKGAAFKRVSSLLQVEKVVLNMTLPNVGNALIPQSGSVGAEAAKKKNQDTAKKNNFVSSDAAGAVLNLYVMSLMAVITGQRPILTKARKSIANWKIRKNQILGCKVTLRGKVALEFLDKTIRFQNIHEQDAAFAVSDAKVKGKTSIQQSELKVGRDSAQEGAVDYALQSLGNLSIGIKNINLYPELEDLWIAQNLGSKKLGLDLSLNFKNNNELYQIINYIIRKPGGKKLVADYSKNIQAFPAHIKANKYVLALHDIIQLRKLYLTSLGLIL